MADTADLLGGNQASRAITPARRVVAPTRRTTLPKPRLSTGLRVVTAPVKVPKLTPPKLQSKKDDGGDKGVLGGLFSIPGSALKAIGSGIAAIPTLVGKGAQEIYGLGELTFDNILDAIDEDIFTSRLETDYQRGKEQGLQGDELYAYAMHRQHPFSGAIFSSMARTGGRVAELGSLGFYNYGQPGIDYATAFRKGDLGATLVEDIGNVILAGRMTGAGNVVARAGGAIAETAPRLGKAVATTGRLIEEPIGETVRQAAGVAGRVAPRLRTATEGMKYAPGETTTQRFINRTEAIADAETPVRILFQQIGDAYRAGQEARLGRLDVERAGLIDQRDAASAAGDNVRASQLQADIERLDATIGKRVEGKGLVKRGRQIARRTKLLGERAGQTVIQQFNRVRDYGVAPQTVEVYRAQASRLRQQADQVEGGAGPYPDYVAIMAGQESPQTIEAQRLRQQADSLDQLADLKEQYPEQMSGPVPAAVQEAAIHLATKVKGLVALADQGLTIEDLVRAATDPSINPDLAKSGMQPTAEGVQLAIDVYRALRGEATNLNPAQVMQVTAIFNLLKEWSRTAQESMMRGVGVPEGPVPFTWFEIYPTPSYLAAELAKGGVENRLAEAVLDRAIADFVGAAIDAGVLPPEVLKEWKLNLENPNGNYRRLAKLDPTDAGYRIAFEISRLTFRQLKAQAPNLVMNPRIYPANMRPTIITQRQGVRRVTGYDVETIALELARLEDEFDTLIDANILKGIGNDIRDALDPQKKITKTVYDRVLQRVETIRSQATERRLALESQAATLTAEQRAILDRLYELEQALGDANALLMSQAANPPAMSARLQKVEQQQKDLDDEWTKISDELTRLDDEATTAEQAGQRDAVDAIRAEQERLIKQLEKLDQQQRRLIRNRGSAEQAEPAEAAKQERAQMRGTAGEVIRPAPGAEGPAVGRLRVPRQKKASAEVARLNKADANRTTRLARTRRAIAEQEALTGAAEAVQETPLQRPEFTAPNALIGPELFAEGERPLYLPAGPTRGMVPQRDLEAVQRGEGAGAQTRLQATRERYSGAFVLSLASIAERIKEVTDQQYRNLAVELIIQDPEMASTVEKVLGDDTLAQLQMDAEQAVAVQNIDRTSPEFKTAVNAELGVRISDALERLGYEVVSPQRFDTETGGHAPLGTLSQTIRPDQIAMNSPVMRKNLAQRLFTQFEPAGTRNVPVLIQRSLDKIGNVTSRWKSVVLPLSLRWQIGDAVGIVLFAWTRGDINPIQLVKRIREVIGRMTDPNDPRLASILFGDVLGAGVQGGGAFVDPVIAAGFGAALGGRGLRMEDIAFALEEGRRVLADPNYKPSNAAMNFFNQFRTRAFRFNEAINSIGRSAVFIEKLDGLLKEKGRSLDEIDGPGSLGDADLQQAISDAVDATNQTLGAFSDLSPWEKQVMRQVFPFWSWIKFINKAAYELAANSPERVLLAAHLGSMMSEGEDTGLADWLRGKTPVMGYFVDLNFLNPYADAAIFAQNPFTDVLETGSSVSPAITFPLTVANELYYGATGKFLPLQASPLSRPGYLEGRPEATTRGLGDVLGGIGYKGLQTFGGPFRNILDVLPTGTIPGTDVATGPVARFGQGSLRTSGAFAEPRLGPVAGRISPLLRTFGVPAPLIEQDKAKEQAKKQAQRDRAARLRRIGERKAAGQ